MIPRALVFFAVLLLGSPAFADAVKKPLDLRSAELYLHTLEGADTKLAPFAGKKLTLLNLWATWCGPCLAEMPDLEKLGKKYEHRGFRVVGLDINEPQAAVKQFLAKHKVAYSILLSTEGKTVAAIGDLEALPTSLLLDEAGDVLEVLVGAIDVAYLAKIIDTRLGAGPAPKPAPKK